MNSNTVLERLARICGLDTSTLEKLLPLVNDAIEEIRSILLPGAENQQTASELNSAAAWLVLYRYTLISSVGDGAVSFGAGDVKVTLDLPFSVNSAKELWQNSFEGIRRLCLDEAFYFGRI